MKLRIVLQKGIDQTKMIEKIRNLKQVKSATADPNTSLIYCTLVDGAKTEDHVWIKKIDAVYEQVAGRKTLRSICFAKG